MNTRKFKYWTALVNQMGTITALGMPFTSLSEAKKNKMRGSNSYIIKAAAANRGRVYDDEVAWVGSYGQYH